jgi:hypothetical protein
VLRPTPIPGVKRWPKMQVHDPFRRLIDLDLLRLTTDEDEYGALAVAPHAARLRFQNFPGRAEASH